MSFLSTLKTIGVDALKVLGIALPAVETVSSLLLPGLSGPAAAIGGLIQKGITIAEMAIQTEQAGAAKKESATTIIQQELPSLEALLAEFKVTALTPAQQAALSSAIDGAVAVQNGIAAILAGFKAK